VKNTMTLGPCCECELRGLVRSPARLTLISHHLALAGSRLWDGSQGRDYQLRINGNVIRD